MSIVTIDGEEYELEPQIISAVAFCLQSLEKQIQSLQEENERLKQIYIKLTNSDPVINDYGEIIGYTATHDILNEFDEIFKDL